MVKRCRTKGNTVSLELKSIARTDVYFFSYGCPENRVPRLSLENCVVSDLEYFIASLFVDSKNGPVGIHDEDEGRLIIDVNSRLHTSRSEGNILEDDPWKPSSIEIQ